MPIHLTSAGGSLDWNMIVALQWIKQGTNRGQPSIEKGGGSVHSLYLTGSFDPLKYMSHRGKTPWGNLGLGSWITSFIDLPLEMF